MTRPSFTTSGCRATCLSVIPSAPTVCPLPHPHITRSVCHMDTSICRTTHQSVCQSTHKSVALSIHTTASLFIIPICTSYVESIHHPVYSSMICQSVTPSVSPEIHLSDPPSLSDCLYTILPCPSGCPTSSDCSSNLYTCPSDCPLMPDHLYNKPPSLSDHPSLPDHLYDEPLSPSACLSLSDCLAATTTHPPRCLSSHTIHCTHDSSQSLAVMNGSNPASPRNSVGPLLTTTYFYVP